MDIGGGGTDGAVLARISALETGKAPILGSTVTLFRLIGANLNSTVDQALEKMLDFGAYVVDRVIVGNVSTPVTNAKAGIYTGVSKSGIPIVNAGQTFAGLGTTASVINPPIDPDGTGWITDQTMYFSTSVTEGSAATASVFVMGQAAT